LKNSNEKELEKCNKLPKVITKKVQKWVRMRDMKTTIKGEGKWGKDKS
jgi:hypothetical protein